MNFDEPMGRQKVVEAVAAHIEEVVIKALQECTRTCLNCDHFREGPADRSNETCGLNGLTPPPSIAVKGCEKHMDKIPF